ncbi:MAG: CPBP family intramembrane glutamic endopeptidase [Leptolyngbya sp. BL-A-14]
MTMLSSHIKRYPLAWFYILSVLIVILIIPAFIVTGAGDTVTQAFERTGSPFNTDLVTWTRLVSAFPSAFPGALLALLQVASPDLAVVIVVGIAYGRKGFLDLKRRFRFWSREIPWKHGIQSWAICVSIFAGMSLATAGLSRFILPIEGFAWSLNFLSFDFLRGLLIAMFLDGGALFEENGWRGFALPLLLKRFDPLAASIVLGLMWTFWHVPVKFDLALTYGVHEFFLMFSVLTAKFVLLTIIMTYFWNQVGQTTIIAIVMHGLSNDSVRLGGNILSEVFQSQLKYEINLMLPMLAVSFILIMLKGKLLGLEPNAKRVV